jgi:hypothetical protein
MLRLITPGEGTPDTRRPAPRTELDFGDPNGTAKVLEHLARARPLTLEQDTVDLAHEALIAAWPRLQAWINEARDRLRLHRQLTEAARTWDDLDRDPGALYRDTRLTAAEDTFLRTDAESDLTALEREFLVFSTTARRREEEAAGRTTRRLRQFALALSILLVLALTAGLIAWQQYRLSEQQRHQALTAQRMAVSRQLAAESDGLIGAKRRRASCAYVVLAAAAVLLVLADAKDPKGLMEVVAVVGGRGQELYRDVIGSQPRQRGQDGDCEGGALGEGADRLAPDPGDGALWVDAVGSRVQLADQPSAIALDADPRVLCEVGAGLLQREGSCPRSAAGARVSCI